MRWLRTLFPFGIFAFSFLCLLDTQASGLAPSCNDVFTSYDYKGEAQGKTLLVLLDGKLVDVTEATLPPRRSQYEFYYVYHSKHCSSDRPCIANSIIAIKTLKVTNAIAPPFISLSREAEDHELGSIAKSEYDEFHKADEIIPPDELNDFHISYADLSRRELHTHYPSERRRIYLFNSIPAGKSPWLRARNYLFARNINHSAQCIRITMQLQPRTEAAAIEVIEIEDGGGGSPQEAQQWDLRLK